LIGSDNQIAAEQRWLASHSTRRSGGARQLLNKRTF
jgi:hypothetical protein